MLKSLLLLTALLSPAHAIESEWHVRLVGALELPGLQSQSPTDFDLATWATGLEITYGTFNWLHLGGRMIYSQVNGAIDDYSFTAQSGTTFDGTLLVDMSAWRTEALAQVRLVRGLSVEPTLIIAGGYTWTVYGDPILEVEGGEVGVATDTADFAEGTWTVSAALNIGWRVMPFLEVGFGAEISRYFDGLYSTAVRFPLSVSGVFWGPL